MRTGEYALSLHTKAAELGKMPDDDNARVLQFAAGNAAEFDYLFDKYQEYVFRTVYGIIGEEESARDVTQEVFVQAYRKIGSFRGGSKFSTWLYRIAVNKAADHCRKCVRQTRLAMVLGKLGSATRNDMDVLDEQDAVQAALMQCPLTHREVLVLRYYRELELDEIAEVLDVTAATARVRLHRARAVFREKYVSRSYPGGIPTRMGEGNDAAK
jgi:RNA polymerase sigma-70 factor (ECF subfamily)